MWKLKSYQRQLVAVILKSVGLYYTFNDFFYCCCSVTQLCPALGDPMDWSIPGFPVLHYLPGFPQTHVHCVSDAIHLILCRTLPFLPSIFPNIRVFPNESVLCIRWPKYWSFNFSISPSNEYSELISFRIDRFDLLLKGLSRVFSSTTIQEHQFFGAWPFLWSHSHIHTWLLEEQ